MLDRSGGSERRRTYDSGLFGASGGLGGGGGGGGSDSSRQANATLSFFVFKLFLKTLLPAILMHKNNTRISYEMFNLLNKLLTETPVASMITVIEPMDQVVTSLVLMIKERPLLET